MEPSWAGHGVGRDEDDVRLTHVAPAQQSGRMLAEGRRRDDRDSPFVTLAAGSGGHALAASGRRPEQRAYRGPKTPTNNALKLTRGEGGSHSSGAPSRASRARSFLSRRAQLNAVFYGRKGARSA